MASHTPSESEILTSYLLHPSPLSTILPYKSFLALLPPSAASFARQHPTELKRLYRDLQFQRAIVIDEVRQRIENECHRSVALTAMLGRQIRREEGTKKPSRKRKRADSRLEDGDGENPPQAADDDSSDDDAGEQETRFDTALHSGQTLGNTLLTASVKHNHTTTTLLPAMTAARRELSCEIADLKDEIETLRAQSKDVVGSLSDLRYGRFAPVTGRASGDKKSGTNAITTTSANTEDEMNNELEAVVVDTLKGFVDLMEGALSDGVFNPEYEQARNESEEVSD
ncbi:hypothetical protein AYO21_06878 [Fonsecaea monophora]|uniref:Uncharacterized protein n=1 Tax=Fonsecaea monophora TaxID=254056 RepID=A0A177F3E3_9EURO|nr:hypothetical protein AYO21_06878 [Fonsecaea monophora]KAH0841241.1 hypothetical protein FOPE_06478 [Fonsecaea pedrosoi]OAG38847.1 hypothetical protein AYO21_06878 [Fonsecaea monophora]